MPIYEKHIAPFYREENGIHNVYAQSVVPSAMIPFYLHRNQSFPPLVLLDERSDIIGKVDAVRFFYYDVEPDIDRLDLHNVPRRIVAGYTLPYMDKRVCVPFLHKGRVYTVLMRFTEMADGSYKMNVEDDFKEYTHFYLKFTINDQLMNHFRKYFNDRNFSNLFHQGALEPFTFTEVPPLKRVGDTN